MSQIGDYQVGIEIGRGSFATVYLGKSTTTSTTVAIKSIAKRKLSEKLQVSLKQEINILRNINHQNIVSLYEIVRTERHIHLIMEYCQYGDLSIYIKNKGLSHKHSDSSNSYSNPLVGQFGGLADFVVDNFLKQLSNAMEFLRSHSLIHRDLKPQNILLAPASNNSSNFDYSTNQSNTTTTTGRVYKSNSSSNSSSYSSSPKNIISPFILPVLKLADFGFARLLPSQDMASTLCGSPLYMAPEILRGESYDAKADLWSLGTVIYEMSYGKPPFRAQNHIELLKKIDKTTGIKFPDDANEHQENNLIRNPSQSSIIIPRVSVGPIPIRQVQNPRSSSTGNSPNILSTTPTNTSSPKFSVLNSSYTRDGIKDLLKKLLKVNPAERLTFEEFFIHPCVVGFKSVQSNVHAQTIIESSSHSLKSSKSLQKLREIDETKSNFGINSAYHHNFADDDDLRAAKKFIPSSLPTYAPYSGNNHTENIVSTYSISPVVSPSLANVPMPDATQNTPHIIRRRVSLQLNGGSGRVYSHHDINNLQNSASPSSHHSSLKGGSKILSSSKIPVSTSNGVLLVETPFPGYNVDPSVFIDIGPTTQLEEFTDPTKAHVESNQINILKEADPIGQITNSAMLLFGSDGGVSSGGDGVAAARQSSSNGDFDDYVVIEKDTVRANWLTDQITSGSSVLNNNNLSKSVVSDKRGFSSPSPENKRGLNRGKPSEMNIDYIEPPFLVQRNSDQIRILIPGEMDVPFLILPDEDPSHGESPIHQEMETLNLIVIHALTIHIYAEELNSAYIKQAGSPASVLRLESLNLYLGALALYQLGIEMSNNIWNQILSIQQFRTSGNQPDTTSPAANTEATPQDQRDLLDIGQLSKLVEWIRSNFDVCLEKAGSAGETHTAVNRGRTVERLLYERALELSHAAGMNELRLMDFEGCEIAYEQAILLLESLLNLPQTRHDDEDDGADQIAADGGESGKFFCHEGVTDEDREVVEKLVAGLYVRVNFLNDRK